MAPFLSWASPLPLPPRRGARGWRGLLGASASIMWEADQSIATELQEDCKKIASRLPATVVSSLVAIQAEEPWGEHDRRRCAHPSGSPGQRTKVLRPVEHLRPADRRREAGLPGRHGTCAEREERIMYRSAR